MQNYFTEGSDGHPGVTNGAEWYAICGGIQDWSYVYEETFEITLEQSTTKNPSADLLNDFWTQNKEPLLAYIELVHIGAKGTINNGAGNPIEGATITIAGNTHSISTDEFGDYYRLLLPGSYDITASKLSPYDNTIISGTQSITIQEGTTSISDVEFTLAFCLRGDINQDETLSILDIILMVNMILDPSLTPENTHIIFCEADSNDDNFINGIDIITTVNAILSNPDNDLSFT